MSIMLHEHAIVSLVLVFVIIIMVLNYVIHDRLLTGGDSGYKYPENSFIKMRIPYNGHVYAVYLGHCPVRVSIDLSKTYSLCKWEATDVLLQSYGLDPSQYSVLFDTDSYKFGAYNRNDNTCCVDSYTVHTYFKTCRYE